MKDRLDIIIDLDGVIWDLLTPWLEYYNRLTNENIKIEDIKTYEIKEYVKYPELLPKILEMDDFWDNVNLYDGVYDSLNDLINLDVKFKIVTSTYYKIAPMKFKRLFELLPMLRTDDIIISYNKSVIKSWFVVDDYYKNFSNDLNTTNIMIRQPYNKSKEDECDFAYNSLKRFIDYYINDLKWS